MIHAWKGTMWVSILNVNLINWQQINILQWGCPYPKATGPLNSGKSTTMYLGRLPWFGFVPASNTISSTLPPALLYRFHVGLKFLPSMAILQPMHNKDALWSCLLLSLVKWCLIALPFLGPLFLLLFYDSYRVCWQTMLREHLKVVLDSCWFSSEDY